MKSAAAIVALIVVAGCASVKAVNAPMENLRMAGSGANAVYPGVREQAIVVYSDQAYRDLYKRMIGADEAPAIDFTKDMVVVLIAGQHPTGGYAIQPRRAWMEGKVLILDAPMTFPRVNAPVTQAFTSPWAVLVLGRAEVDEVRWSR